MRLCIFWKNIYWKSDFDQWGCVFFEKIFIEILILINEVVYFLKKCFNEIRIWSNEVVYFLKKFVIEVVGFSILMINIRSHSSKTECLSSERTYPYPTVPWRCVPERSFLYHASLVRYVPGRYVPERRVPTSTTAGAQTAAIMLYHTVHIHLEYLSVYPLVRIGPSHPLSLSAPERKGGEHTCLRVRGGGGSQFRRLEKSLVLRLLCVLSFLCRALSAHLFCHKKFIKVDFSDSCEVGLALQMT